MSKVLSALGGALPDERPLLSLQIVESLAKCPAGYFPVNRTYDEDSDAGLMKQNGLFGKKPSHYICLSKSEGVPGYVLDGVVVVGERETAPPGFSVAGRAGKRRLCTRLSRPAQPAAPPLTDVIVCSKMRQAPAGFMLAGEINGKMVCYKVSGGSADTSPTHKQPDYENVTNSITPEVNRRLKPSQPKLSPLISELNGMNLKQVEPTDDYETLSITYVKPARPAPRPPSVSAPVYSPPPPGPMLYLTLGGQCPLDGVPFLLNPKLRGLPADHLQQIPHLTKRSKFDLDRDYSYNFSTERQA